MAMRKGMKPGRRYFIINIDEPYAEEIYEALKRGQMEKGEWPEGDVGFEEWKKQTFGSPLEQGHTVSLYCSPEPEYEEYCGPFWTCPACGSEFILPDSRYCPDCGRAIEWVGDTDA